MASFARIRLIAAIAGFINLILVIVVVATPFWRTTVSTSVDSVQRVWGYEGLWIECMSFYNQQTQCYQIGSMSNNQATGQRYAATSYYKYGVYAHLTVYRVFMIIALVSELAAVPLSLAGMKCTKPLREGSNVKRWVNITAGICHFVAGVMTGISCSWYAAEVLREYSSPYYQTNRIKYTLGACLFMGWISMAVSLVLGCLLTCCTCCNRPLDDTEYQWKPPISEIEIEPRPIESMIMAPEVASYYDHDEWDDDTSRYTSSKKSHKSHRSHKSRKSHRSHRSDKRSAWDDDYDNKPRYRDDYGRTYDGGFV